MTEAQRRRNRIAAIVTAGVAPDRAQHRRVLSQTDLMRQA